MLGGSAYVQQAIILWMAKAIMLPSPVLLQTCCTIKRVVLMPLFIRITMVNMSLLSAAQINGLEKKELTLKPMADKSWV